MKDNNTNNSQDFEDLSRRVDALLDGDLDQYTPAGLDTEDGTTYQNFSNGYSRPQSAEYRNYGSKRPATGRPGPPVSGGSPGARAAAAAAAVPPRSWRSSP